MVAHLMAERPLNEPVVPAAIRFAKAMMDDDPAAEITLADLSRE